MNLGVGRGEAGSWTGAGREHGKRPEFGVCWTFLLKRRCQKAIRGPVQRRTERECVILA
jgi:hypothetical protein